MDRGGRELPIAADFVAREVSVQPGQSVRVRIGENASDDDGVFVESSEGEPS